MYVLSPAGSASEPPRTAGSRVVAQDLRARRRMAKKLSPASSTPATTSKTAAQRAKRGQSLFNKTRAPNTCVVIYREQLDEDGQGDFKGKAKAFLRT